MPTDDPAIPDAPAPPDPGAPGRRLPTSHDVALAAGVSQPTVSRALRGDPRVTEATRRRVLAAAERLGYVTSDRGRSLVDGAARAASGSSSRTSTTRSTSSCSTSSTSASSAPTCG